MSQAYTITLLLGEDLEQGELVTIDSCTGRFIRFDPETTDRSVWLGRLLIGGKKHQVATASVKYD